MFDRISINLPNTIPPSYNGSINVLDKTSHLQIPRTTMCLRKKRATLFSTIHPYFLVNFYNLYTTGNRNQYCTKEYKMYHFIPTASPHYLVKLKITQKRRPLPALHSVKNSCL